MKCRQAVVLVNPMRGMAGTSRGDVPALKGRQRRADTTAARFRRPTLRAATGTVTFRVHLFGNGPFEFTGLGGPGDDLVVAGSVSSLVPPKAPVLSAELNGTALRLRFASEAGVTYTLQRSRDFTDWEFVRLLTGTGAVFEVEEPLAAAGERFFRLLR